MIKVDLYKSFKHKKDQFDLNLKFNIINHSFTAISGLSGAGKTTLLRMIAGLEKPDGGVLSVDMSDEGTETWFDGHQKINLKPQKRKVGMVFQQPALFPNMTVLENLQFASSFSLDKIIQLTDLQDIISRNIHSLSGGQQQRVALARALAQEPNILLLDEPLSALDNTTRYALQQTLIRVHKSLKLTTLMVTHDQSEILRLADFMILIENGRIAKSGHPVELITGSQLSGKFQFQGDLVAIQPEGVLYLASVLVGNQLIQVVLDKVDVASLQVGDKVSVASKAFNPIVRKIG
jgi:molybdate transport system ATP-binding protein